MFCTKCGAKINEGDKFCEKCGNRLLPVSEETATNQEQTENQVPERTADNSVNETKAENQVPENTADNSVNETKAENQVPENTADNSVNETKAENQAPESIADNSVNQESIQQTYNLTNEIAVQPQNVDITQTAVKPQKQKKPLNKKAIILCAVAAVLVIAIVVTLIIVIPMFNKIKINEEYIKFDFDSSEFYEGHGSLTVSIDEEKLSDDYDVNIKAKDGLESLEDIDDIKDLGDLINSIGGSSSSSASIYSIISYCDISAEVKDADEKATNDDADSNSGGDKASSQTEFSSSDDDARLTNLKSSDVIIVSVKWPESKSDLRTIEEAEKKLGISFDKSDRQYEFALNSILEDEGISVLEATDSDPLGYIESNKLYTVTGFKDKELEFSLSDFEYTEGDYTYSYDTDDYYITIKKDSVIVDKVGISVKNDDSYYSSGLSSGEKVTLYLDEEYIPEEGLFFTETKKDIVVEANTPLTLDEAKSNVELIKTTFNEVLKDKDFYNFTNPEVVSIYYVTPKKNTDSKTNVVAAVVKGKYKGWLSDKEEDSYLVYYFIDCYVSDGKFVYSRDEYDSSNKNVNDAIKYATYLNSDNYSYTKIAG